MTPQTTQSIAVRLQRVLPAPPARIYRAWLDPALLERWYAATGCTVRRVEVQERPGGRHAVWQTGPDGEDIGGFESTLVELVPDERLVFDFNFVGPDRKPVPEHESRLTVELRPEGDGETRLTLVHERLEAFAAAMPEVAGKVEPGWQQALGKLAAAV